MKVKEESEKVGLKLHSENWSWHLVLWLDGKYMGKQWKQWETIFWGLKMTVDGDCSHEIKRICSLEEKLWPTLTAY